MNSISVILLFILHLAFYSFFTYFDNEKIKWMMIVMCKKKEKQLQKSRIFYILMRHSARYKIWCGVF